MELTLFVDHQCNLRCDYCYTGAKFARRMSSDVMHKALALALESAPPWLDVHFFGGEPLLHRAFLQECMTYAERAVRERSPHTRLRFAFNTNATLVDDALLELLAPPRECFALVSLDGPAPVHDRHRFDAQRLPSHARVREGIRKLQGAGIDVALLAVVTPQTCGDLGAVVQELLSVRGDSAALSFHLGAEWDDEALGRLRRGLQDVEALLIERFRRGTPVQLDPLHSKILTHVAGGIPCPRRCMLEELAVAPSGRIYPCAQLVGEDRDDTFAVGHVDVGLDKGKIARLLAEKQQVEPLCATCALRTRCQSHCACTQVALSGQMGRIDARLCNLEEAVIEAADRIAETLWTEQCPSFLTLYYETKWVPTGPLTQLRRARETGNS